MEHYDFEVVNGSEKIVIARHVVVTDVRAMWSRIGSIAKDIDKPGCLIRVTDAGGKIVALVGVATAIRLCVEVLGTLPLM
jgi:hypothetical protein